MKKRIASPFRRWKKPASEFFRRGVVLEKGVDDVGEVLVNGAFVDRSGAELEEEEREGPDERVVGDG